MKKISGIVYGDAEFGALRARFLMDRLTIWYLIKWNVSMSLWSASKFNHKFIVEGARYNRTLSQTLIHANQKRMWLYL